MKSKILIVLFLIVMVAENGCKKFVTVPTPQNQISTAQVFADSADAVSAILNIYISNGGLSNGINGYGMSLIPGLSADEIQQSGSNADYTQFYADNLLATNNTNLGLWNGAYTNIYDANACIAGLSASTGISTQTKTALIAEAKFIRAYEYFYLVNLYGDVPLPLSTDQNVNASLPRAASKSVFAQIINDLIAAESGLPVYSGTNTRPTMPAASALLAKVYLYTGQYGLAQAEATKVIASGSFQLESNLNNVFLNTSTETIWQLASILPNEGSGDALAFVTTSATAVPKYFITPSLYNSFEAGDLRKSAWIKVNTNKSVAYPFPYKYKQGITTATIDEYEIELRLADVYLVRAEAEIEQNQEPAALADLDMIRNRAGLPNSTATGQAAILTAIQNERRWEFFCERGNRWFDLKRWGLVSAALSPLKPAWNAHDELYPIPATQINYNPKLIQNAGY